MREARHRLACIARLHPELLGASNEENRDGWVAVLREDEMATKLTAVRLPDALLARRDNATERLAQKHRGMTFTRSDAVRVLLTRALDYLGIPDPESGPAKSKKPRSTR